MISTLNISSPIFYSIVIFKLIVRQKFSKKSHFEQFNYIICWVLFCTIKNTFLVGPSVQLIMSACPFWRNISKRSSCSRAFSRSDWIDDERRSSCVGDAPSLPLPIDAVVKLVAVDGCCGDIGGDDAVGLVKNSLCDVVEWNCGGFDAATAFDWWTECCAADIFASNDWNDALGEYKPTPGGKIGDGGALQKTN